MNQRDREPTGISPLLPRRQENHHKHFKMKITEKVQRRVKNLIICLTIICLTPLIEKGRTISGAHTANAFAGTELICAIDLGNEMYSSYGLETGLNYRLMGEFAKDNHCNVTIVAAHRHDNYTDSLLNGSIDILITHDKEVNGAKVLCDINESSSWVMSSSDPAKIRQMNSWISHIKTTPQFKTISDLYSRSFNPHKKADEGITTTTISPYDSIIRKYAKTLGWDWRMVAAVIYQESKFSIGSSSARGAQGLMQVMPQTGKIYGIDNLLDPEQNILAGTSHLKRLQKMFSKYDLTEEELVKFTLAAYNAGEGRIMDCRNLAENKGYDNSRWEEITKVIPLMREDSILQEECVKLGKFQGHETIDYIESVMSHYQAICQICPTSF